MSKGSKKRHSQKRKEMKKSAKAAKKALYLSYAAKGKTKQKGNTQSGIAFNHETSDCGNVGCKKCHPRPGRQWKTANI